MRKLDTKEVATHLAQFGRTMLARAELKKVRSLPSLAEGKEG